MVRAMTPNNLPKGSTLRRPSGKPLEIFHVGMIPRGDTVQTYLDEGWSLGIACKDCPRLVEWTPEDLQERFAPATPIVQIARKLTCSGPSGCGSERIAVFPHSRRNDLEQLERDEAERKRQGHLF